MASDNRKRIRCAPIEGAWSHLMRIPPLPGYTALALLYRETYHVPDGLLVINHNGILGHYQNGALRSIDQRKARAALDSMEYKRKEREAAILAEQKPEPYFDADKDFAEDETDKSRD